MAELTQPAAGTAVERRIVSVLFADLVGFTPLSESLDAEDVAAIQDAYFGTVRETISRYGGTLEKFIGDAAMAVFGTPRTRDDDAERAVRAGLALVSAVEQLAARLGLEPGQLRLRVGINSGEVAHAVAGIDAGRVTGDTVNTAARLQSVAPADGVLIGELTALSVEGAIELADAEPVELKGKAEPIRARRALSVRADASRAEAMGGLRAPILGRDHEIARLETFSGARLTVIAPPGVGKSRLLREVAERLEGRSVRVLRARVRPRSTSPYDAVVELLTAAGARERLDEALDQAGLPPGRREVLRREATTLLEAGSTAPAATADLVDQREARFAAWSALLDILVGPSPVAWIVEDIHWAGPDLLAFLAQAAPGAHRDDGRIILASARPSLLETASDWIAGGEVLHLAALPPTDAAALVSALVGDALPPALVDAVAERSDGNPLFIEELLRTWISVGMLVRGTDGWTLDIEPAGVRLPPTVQAIYAAQLDDLPADARLVARRASVVGRRFAEEALEPLELPDATEGLNRLRHRALVDGPEADALSGSVYVYRHALLRDAGYASLARAERARLHAALASWLERTAGARAELIAEAIGEHYAAAHESMPAIAVGDVPDRGELAAAAARWLARGAERALALAAHDRAIELLERAIGLTAFDDELALAERRLRLGEVVAQVADLDRGIAEMRSALETYAAALPASRDGYARAAHALGSAYVQQIRFDEARDLAAATLESLGPPDDATTARLLGLHALARAAVGDRHGLSEEIERAEAISARIGDPELRLDLLVHRTMVSGETLEVEPPDPGDVERAARAIGRWRTVAGAIRQRAAMIGTRDALAILDEAAEVCESHGLTEQLGWTHYARAELLFTLGDWNASIASAQLALDLAERYAYVRLGFRTWMALLPILAARGDGVRVARFDAWWSEARRRMPAAPSPYGRVLTAASELWRAAARGERAQAPPDALVDQTREPDGNPHFQEALLTIVGSWLTLDPPHIESARAVHAHFAAPVDSQESLEGATRSLMAAWIAAAEGDPATARREARAAADAALIAEAPWWRLRALVLSDEADGEVGRLRAQLGLEAS